MGKPEKKLSARQVATAKPGLLADGGGLYLAVTAAGAKSWIFRYRIGERRRDMGLGSFQTIGLADARAERDKWRAVLASGLDPIDERERQANLPAAAAIPTFGEYADTFIAAKKAEWRNDKHRDQWKMTLEVYAKPLRSKRVDMIATADVLATLKPIWVKKPETASRLRGRIEKILDAARSNGHIDEARANPARWAGHLQNLLAKPSKLGRGHHAALPYADLPAFIAILRQNDATSALALEFTILTAARTGETTGAEWSEIRPDSPVWTIPWHRMKGGREHRVPLCARACEIIEAVKERRTSDFVFPGGRPNKPLSNMAMTMLLRDINPDVTVHGFRSTFRTWATEKTNFASELAEAALAHLIGDETERAYNRTDILERRRALMDAWAAFANGASGGNVVPFPAQA